MASRRLLPISLVAAAAMFAALALAPAAAHAKVLWLCKPGLAGDPCATSLTTTRFSPQGKRLGVERVRPAAHPKVDCFYVYPTVSDQPTPQATQVVDDVLRSIARFQAARYSTECRVFAPVYRQVTIQGLLQPATVNDQMREEGYADVLEAWRTYLARYNHGRGVVLIGHSQGTRVLRRLVTEQVDPKASVRKRLVSALLLGGNVLVKRGSDRGGDFQRVPACRSAKQAGCVVAYSSFNAPVPANSRFGRSTDPSLEVLCTNPAALGGGAGRLDLELPTQPFARSVIGSVTTGATTGLPAASTPWLALPRAYTARCSSADSAHVLQVSGPAGAPTFAALPDPTWGLHLVDANVALGNLTRLVARQIATYTGRRG